MAGHIFILMKYIFIRGLIGSRNSKIYTTAIQDFMSFSQDHLFFD